MIRGDELVCAHGHWLEEVGVYTVPSGEKVCRACRREAIERTKDRKRKQRASSQ